MSSSAIEKALTELNRTRAKIRQAFSTKGLDVSKVILRNRVNKFIDTVEKLGTDIRNSYDSLEVDKGGYSTTVFSENRKELEALARAILRESALAAMATSKEFGREKFKNALLDAIDDTQIAAIMQAGNELVLVYAMDDVAGTLHDYAVACNKARTETLGPPITGTDTRTVYSKEDQKQMASRFWEEKVYEAPYIAALAPEMGKDYDMIMTARWEKFRNAIAPFWSLLNNGNENAPEFGHGIAYPIQKATHFVESATNKGQLEINKVFKKQLKAKATEIENTMKTTENIGNLIQTVLVDLYNIANAIEDDTLRSVAVVKEALLRQADINIANAKQRRDLSVLEQKREIVNLRAEEVAIKIVSGQVITRAELGTYGGYRLQVRIPSIVSTLPDVISTSVARLRTNLDAVDGLVTRATNIRDEYTVLKKLLVR